jgi:transposase
MGRSLTIRKPTTAELRQLQTWLEDKLHIRQLRRAEALLLYATGMTVGRIAQALEVHANTIYADLHAFDQQGVSAIHQLHSLGAPVRISDSQVEEILRIAERPPYELGLPYGRWSGTKLQQYLLKQRIVKALSREHLRRLLQKGALTFGGSGAKSSALIPAGKPS